MSYIDEIKREYDEHNWLISFPEYCYKKGREDESVKAVEKLRSLYNAESIDELINRAYKNGKADEYMTQQAQQSIMGNESTLEELLQTAYNTGVQSMEKVLDELSEVRLLDLLEPYSVETIEELIDNVKAKVLDDFRKRLIEETGKGFCFTMALVDEIIKDLEH